MRRSIQVGIIALLAVAAGTAFAEFHGTVSTPSSFTATSVIAADVGVGCQGAVEALGAPDWDTICILSSDVSTCATKNMSYLSGATCRIHYLCTGWVGDTSLNRYPSLTLGFVSPLTNVTRVEVIEKGHRGWIRDITLIAVDGRTHTVFETPASAWDTPSEEYKQSPAAREGGAYYGPGLDYRGGVNTSRSGHACLPWSAQSYMPRTIENGLAGATNNFCRSPDNDQNGPWCFTAGLVKEYCTIPVSEGCADKALYFPVSPAAELSYVGVRITMKHSQGAIPAIDAVRTTGSVAGACHADPVRGFWAAPNCDTCSEPYKGSECNELSCANAAGTGTYACVYGTCNNATDTCDCYAGFYGASCAATCPTTQDLSAITLLSGKYDRSQIQVGLICSGHGTCDEGASGSGACICAPTYATSTCAVACPRDAATGLVCSNNGTCSDGASGDGTCTCHAPRHGADCSRRLCNAKQCFNGDCLDNARCACKYDETNGFWAGLDCNKCAAGYTGSQCKTEVKNTFTMTGDAASLAAQYSSSDDGTTTFTKYLLPRVDSDFTVTLEHSGGVVEVRVPNPVGKDVYLSPDKTRPTATGTSHVFGGRYGLSADQLVTIDPFAWGDMRSMTTDELKFTITVEYIPGCGLSNDCGHGYCTPTRAALAEALFSSAASTSAKVLSRHGATSRARRFAAAAIASPRPQRYEAEDAKGAKAAWQKGSRPAVAGDAHRDRPDPKKSKALSLSRRLSRTPKHLRFIPSAFPKSKSTPNVAIPTKHREELKIGFGLTHARIERLLKRARLQSQPATTAARKKLEKRAESPKGPHTGRELLAAVPAITPGSPLVSARGEDSLALDFGFDVAGAVTFAFIATGVTPDAMGSGDIFGGVATNTALYQDLDLLSPGGTETVSASGLTECQGYDVYIESADDYSSPTTYSSPSLFATNLKPFATPAVSTAATTAGSTSVSVTITADANAIAYACLTAPGGTVTAGAIRGCGGGQTATFTTGDLTKTLSFTGLSPLTSKDIHYMLATACDADATSVATVSVTTTAAGLPGLTSVTTTSVTGTGFTVTFNSDSAGWVHYAVQRRGASAVTGADIKTVAIGTTRGVVARNSVSVTSGAGSFAVTGLSPGQPYVVRIVTANTPQNALSSTLPELHRTTSGPAQYPTVWITTSAVSMGMVTVSFDYQRDGDCTFAFVPNGFVITGHASGSLVTNGMMPGAQTTLPSPLSSPTGGSDVGDITLPSTCGDFDLYSECANTGNSAFSPLTFHGTFSMNTAANVATISIAQTAASGTSVNAQVAVSAAATVEVCAVPTSGATVDPSVCTGGVKASRMVTSKETFNFPGLSPSVTYDINYRAGTTCPTPVYGTTAKQSVTTTAAGAPEVSGITLLPGTGNVTIQFNAPGPGTMTFVVQDNSGTASRSQSAIDALSVGGSVLLKETVTFSTGKNSFVSATSPLAAGTTYMLNLYTANIGATAHNQYFTQYFSTAGTLPDSYIYVEYENSHGQFATVSWGTDYQAVVRYQVRLQDEDTPTVAQMLSETGTFVVSGTAYLDMDGFGGLTTGTFDVRGLEPLTNYYIYYHVTDSAGIVIENKVWGSYFETNDEGVAHCGSPANNSPCTKASATNTQGVCACFPGYTCDGGRCIDPAELYAGLGGKCECDASATLGHWNGTQCQRCLDGYFGSDCTISCVNGVWGGTSCTCTGHFTGARCDVCPIAKGYYGPGCDTKAAPVTTKLEVSTSENKVTSSSTVTVLEYSEVFLNISMQQEDVVGAFKIVELVLMKQYAPSSLAGYATFDSAGNLIVADTFGQETTGPTTSGSGLCSVTSEADLSLTSTSNTLITSCHLERTWDATESAQSCRVQVPLGYHYAMYRIVGDRPATADLTFRATGGCCNGKGFCGKFEDDCTCVAHPDLGFYNVLDECATCARGYTGSSCTDFAGDARELRTGKEAIAIGEARWFTFGVQENMKLTATMAADADCDLSVTTVSRCGEGWYHYDGRCYKIFADPGHCTTPKLAANFCKKQGGQVASVRSAADMTFFGKMFTDTGVGDQEQAKQFCSTRVIVDGLRVNPKCADPSWVGKQNEALCNAEGSGACTWTGAVCQFNANYECYTPTSQASAANCKGTTGSRRACQWVQYASPSRVSGTPDQCQPTFKFRDSTMTAEAVVDMVSDPTISDIGTMKCDLYDFDEVGCALLPYCTYDKMSDACNINTMLLHGLYWNGFLNDYFEDKWYYGADSPKCAYVSGRTVSAASGASVYLGEMDCDVRSQAAGAPSPIEVSSSSIAYGSAAVMCERPLTAVESVVDASNVVSAVVDHSSLLGVPSCQQDGPETSHTCSLSSRTGENFAVVRVVCQTAATYEVNVSMVRHGRLDGYFNTLNCYHSASQGSWGGQICTECAPRYSGHDCKTFDACTADSQCNQGTCNLGTGYCVCSPNYYGSDCATFCDASTCNGGTCNANYQVCPGALGTSRPCSVEDPLCTGCPGQLAGDNCETCNAGYWEPASNCGLACNCNGQPCDVTTGACLCHEDSVAGYWNETTNCSTCEEGFYGVGCNVECDATLTCNDHGTCGSDGYCVCEANYYGATCETFCTTSYCNNHGTCESTTGACVCASSFATGFWTGSTCSECSAGYWGSSCNTECQCNARGSCDVLTGACVCYSSPSTGYFTGSSCKSCAQGWSGSDCKTSTDSSANKMGVRGKTLVSTSARLVKNRIGGTTLEFVSGGVTHLWVTTGKQLSEFTRPATSVDSGDWAHTQSCTLGASTVDDNVLASEHHSARGYALFLVNKTGGMMISAVRTDGSTWVGSDGACVAVSATLYARSLYGSNNTGGTAESALYLPKGMVLDASTNSIYVLYRVLNSTLSIDLVQMSRIFIWADSDIRKGFTHPRQNQYRTFGELKDANTITMTADADGTKAVFISGVDAADRIIFVKVFLPTAELNTLRPVYSWNPAACRGYTCAEVACSAVAGSKLVSVIRTTDSLGASRMLVTQARVDGTYLKETSTNYNAGLNDRTDFLNCSFIIYDSYADTLYMGGHNNGASPGTVVKVDAAFERTYPSTLPLSYEQTTDEKQIAVAARIDADRRELMLVNQLTRSHLMHAMLYEVEAIEPNVVDGNGGTLVNVTGNGFKDLGAGIFCKFGSRLNRQLAATFVDSTRIICQAPMVTTFDPCVAVPLEIAFSGTSSFTDNQVPVTQANIPQVSNVLPAARGGLTLSEPLTIVGSGFINTAYLTCTAVGKRYPATFVSSTSVLCQPDSQAVPVNTTLQVSLDGQSFTNNNVYYYFVGPPSFFTPAFGTPRVVDGVTYGAMTDRGFVADSAQTVYLPKVLVTFYDAAFTDLQSRDAQLRGHVVSVSLASRPVSPKDPAVYGQIRGTLTATISLGVAEFTDLFLEYPGSGSYTLTFGTSAPGLPNRTITFTIAATATRLVFTQQPPDSSTNKEALATPTVVVFSDVSANTATSELAKVTPTLEKINGTDNTTFGTLSGSDEDTTAGVATFETLRIENGEESAFYRIVFTATTANGLVLRLDSGPIRVAQCDATVNWISRVVPDIGTLGAQVVTIKGWGYTKALESRTYCKFGSEPAVPTKFLDKCNVLCALPARSAPVSAPLEVTTTTLTEFSNYGLNYSYISTVESLAPDTDARASYASAAVVDIDPITLRFRDAFPSWVRHLDTTQRTVHMKTNAPLLNVTGTTPSALNTSGTAMVRFSGLRIGYPLIGSYGFFFSTDPNAPMPTIVGAANGSSTLTPVTPAPTSSSDSPIVIVVNQTLANGSSCPVPLKCSIVGRRFVECLYPLPEAEVSFTPTMSEEQMVPVNAANVTLAPVPTPVPPPTAAPTTTAAPSSANTPPPAVASLRAFSALYLFAVTEGVPAELHFVGTYDLFTTGKRRLDRQPTIRIADVAGNTVTNFAAAPTVTATVTPQPPCLTAAAAGTSQAEYEATCERLSGSTVQVSNGIAAFTSLRFNGETGTQYRLRFTINLAGVAQLVGGPMYTAVCPAGNALLDHIEPNWVTNTRGGVITAKGWDFQPDSTLQLRVGADAITCNYVDTCTALCPVTAVALSSRRAAATPGSLDVSFASGTTQSASQSGAFQVKAASATHIGYAKTARSYYRSTATPPTGYNFTHGQTLTLTSNVTCTLLDGETTSDARDCYTSAEVVNVLPVFVSQQDSGGGDIFEQHGWDPATNRDVTVTLMLARQPSLDTRPMSAIFRGNLTKRTVLGLVAFDNLQMVLPKSGDYVITMNTTDATSAGASFVSFQYTIRVAPGQPRTLTVTSQLARNVDDNGFKVENNVGLGITAFIRDVSDNSIDITALPGYIRLSMIATITPEVILQPPPLQHIPVSPHNGVLNNSVFSGSPTDLVSGFFDFSTATVNNLKFGARYNMTFSIDNAALSVIMPPQSLLVTLGSCPSGQYSRNMTATCATLPEGAETRTGNHTLWLYSLPGFWRPSFQDATFYACPGSNCNGGYYSDCVDGTTGPVCAVCEEDWGKQGTQCLQCPSDTINALVLVGIAITTLLVIAIMVNSNLSAEVKPKSVFSIVIKILLNHLQTATLMQDFQSKIKGIVKDLFDVQSQATPDTNFTSFSCLTGWNMYAIFLMWMLVPIFVLGIPGIIAAVAAITQRRSLAQKKLRLVKELARRQAMGLKTADLQMHLEALETRDLPEEVFQLDTTDDFDRLSAVATEENAVVDYSLEELERREMESHERRQKRREERDAAVAHQGKVLFRGVIAPQPSHGPASPSDHSALDDHRASRPTSATGPASRRQSRAHPSHIRFGDDGKPLGGGLDNCTICCADFAIYRCEECPDEPLFCESCWKVVHATEGERADHDCLMYKVENADNREVNQKYAKLYEEVMATKNKVPALEIWIVTVLVVIFLIYPSLMTQIAMMMKCVYIESIDRSFLAADYTIECGTPEYNRWATIAQIFFFLYGVGIPLAGTILLTVKRKTLLEKATMATYGFLYSGYRLRFFYWEFVIMVRKMLVVFIIVFYAGDSNYSIMFGMWLVLAFLILNIMVQPFQLRLYWRLENISLASVTITLNAAMLYQPRFNLGATEDGLVTLFIFIVNVLVLAMFAYYVYFAAKLELLQHFDIDGSGDVSWSEFVLVVKQWLHTEHGEALTSWGFAVEDPSEEIAAIRQKRKDKKLQAATDNWKRGALLRARQKEISAQNTPQESEAATPPGSRAPTPDAEFSDAASHDGHQEAEGAADDLNSAKSNLSQPRSVA